MGQLPAARVQPTRAFLHTGHDYAGPITLKTFQGRGAKTYKGWIAVFVCMFSSAVHLELVTDYTAAAFTATSLVVEVFVIRYIQTVKLIF
ncbi:GSCOCG00011869001-RA-CDS [Cotesia congregata]|nr:GSCOCG00011869001-RA-CDS [Cotesia congregata]